VWVAPILRIHDGQGPRRRLGSLWQRHRGERQRVMRSTRLPSRHRPSPAISGMGGCSEIVFGFAVTGLVAVHVSKGPAGE
jgi:hypothetical protein